MKQDFGLTRQLTLAVPSPPHMKSIICDLPSSVIATKPHMTGPWSEGALRQADHNLWKVCTTDSNKKKTGHTVTIGFNSALAPGVYLGDNELCRDRQTKKVLCIQALTAGFGSGPIGATGLNVLALRYDSILRWRLDFGAASFSKLCMQDFAAFVSSLRGTSGIGLLDVEARLDLWQANLESGAMVLPLLRTRTGFKVVWGEVAGQVGLTLAALKASPILKAELQKRLNNIASACPKALADKCALFTVQQTVTPGIGLFEGYFSVWHALYYASMHGSLQHDRLRFNPFEGGSPYALAKRFGAPKGRTSTLEPQQLFRLLRAATRWVLEHGVALIDLVASSSKSDQSRLSGTENGLVSIMGGSGAVPLHTAVRHFMAACAILIGSLAGRRGGEVESLRAGCVGEPLPGVFNLSIYIEKTVQDLDKVVVPSLLALIVRYLEALTRSTRERFGGDWLFRVSLPGTDKIINLNLFRDLQDFATTCGLEMGPNALEEGLASHMLRRGFATLFYSAYQIGSPQALQRQLRHTDLNSTQIYVSGVEPGQMTRLRDRLDARYAAALKNLEADEYSWLCAERQRLTHKRAQNRPLNEVLCEEPALLLLDSPYDHTGFSIAAAASQKNDMLRKLASGIRFGSQVQGPTNQSRSLMERVQAYRTAIFGTGAIS